LIGLYNFRVKKIKIIIAAIVALGLVPHFVFAATTTTTLNPQPLTLNAEPEKASGFKDFVRKKGDFESAVVIDYKTKKVLYSYKPDIAWPGASLTKLMGTMVFLDKKFSPNTVVAIKGQDEVGGGRLQVDSGSTMTIKDIIYSSIVGSANNAATAMARISGMGMKSFVAAMNKKAKTLGCKYTTYKDASGMDKNNVTTANDMVKIATAAFSIPEIRRPATTAYYKFKVRNTGVAHTIKSTNRLLLDENNGLYVTGGKTGYLDESKNNLVFRVRPDAKSINKELLIVVFGADVDPNDDKARLFDSASRLAKWSWLSYTWSK